MFKKIRSKIMHSKVYAQRAMSYVSLINAGMLLFLTLSNLEAYGIDIKIKNWIVPLFVLGALGLITVGFLEDKLGFFKEEAKIVSKRNPSIEEIKKRLKNIEDKLEKL